MYSAKIDGQPTTFGTSGLLYRSNKLMYDRQTNSLWRSLTGEPVIGKLAQRDDLKLDFFPVSLTTWGDWLAEYPDTTVLSNRTGRRYPARFYGPEEDPRSIYYDYRATTETMFPIWDRDLRLDPKDEVMGIISDGVSKAYPVTTLRRLRVVNDIVGDREIVVVASSASSDVRVFERAGHTFAIESGDEDTAVPRSLIDDGGARWELRDDSLVNTLDETQALSRVPSNVSFWFGWFAFHPDTELFSEE